MPVGSGVAFAATFTVTDTLDGGPGSLRQIILDANASPGADAINFKITGAAGSVRTITLPTEPHDITETVSIDGHRQPVASADALRSVADSDTVFGALYGPSFVLTGYFGRLRRNLDDAPDANFSGHD
jgi:hypothetical protein